LTATTRPSNPKTARTFASTSSVNIRKPQRWPDWTDEQIWALNRGGHDPKKVFAALKKAQETKGKATVILAHTIKGYGMGDTAEGKNIAHQVKKMNMDGVRISAIVSMCRLPMSRSKTCRT
jgi:pyruvate dehydrogenase complex dehydrogenase (E1) component